MLVKVIEALKLAARPAVSALARRRGPREL
jgi:hypothetical protein